MFKADDDDENVLSFSLPHYYTIYPDQFIIKYCKRFATHEFDLSNGCEPMQLSVQQFLVTDQRPLSLYRPPL